MANLNPLELERLKSLLSGKALTMGEKISTLDMLRSRLPGFFSSLKPGLTEENLKDNTFLIKYLTNPYNSNKIKNALRSELSLSTAQEIDLEQALSEKPVAAEEIDGQPTSQEATPATGQEAQPIGTAGSSAGGMPFGIPSAPSISPRPGRVFISKVPQTPEPPKPEISIASSSGTIIKGPGAEVPPSEFHVTDKHGNITETYSRGPAPAAQTPQPKLVLARSDGSIIEPAAPTSKIAITDSKGNIVREHTIPTQGRFNFSAFKSRLSNLTKKAQNFASPAGPFLKVNLSRIGRGIFGAAKTGLETANPFLGRMGAGLANGLTSIVNPEGMGGIGGGSRSILGKLGRVGRGGRGGGSLIGKAKGRGGLVFAISLIGFMVLVGALTAFSPNPTPGEASPLSTGVSSDLDKKYDFTSFDIFKNDAVNDSLLQKYINRALTTGKVKEGEQKDELPDRAKIIRDQAQIAGLNPAIFLGYWESESGFSDYTHPGVRPGSDLGCDPRNPELKTFEDSVLCAVGKSQTSNSRTSQCAISKDINSPACQAIVFQQAEGVKLPISTLKDFLNSYGSKVADPNNLRSDNIVKQTIADLGLVPSISTPVIPKGQEPEAIASSAQKIAAELKLSSDPNLPWCIKDKDFGISYHCWDQQDMIYYNQPGLPGDEDYLQCTEFVWAVFAEIGLGKEIGLIKDKDAGDWADAAGKYPSIFNVFPDAGQLQKGDIVSLAGTVSGPSGGNSHVAVVIDRGDGWVKVAQAATSSPFETWKIDINGKLDPLMLEHPGTREYIRGFIRLVGRL